jgi:hypothetical protein
VLALLANVLAGAVYAPAKILPLLDDLLGPLVICTAEGAKTAPAGGGGSDPHGAAQHCTACVLVAQVALAVAIIQTAIVFPTPVAVRLAPLELRAPARYLSLGGIGSRAPPLSA